MAGEEPICIMLSMFILALIMGLVIALVVNALADTLPSHRVPGGPRVNPDSVQVFLMSSTLIEGISRPSVCADRSPGL